MSGKEDKLQCSMLNYFSVQAEAGLVLPVVSTPYPQPTVELQSNAELQCLHEQPPDKEKRIDVTEPTSICDAAASDHYHNDNYLEPWTSTYASKFASPVRVDQPSHTKSGVERRRRLFPGHLEDFPWLAVSRSTLTPSAFPVFCSQLLVLVLVAVHGVMARMLES